MLTCCALLLHSDMDIKAKPIISESWLTRTWNIFLRYLSLPFASFNWLPCCSSCLPSRPSYLAATMFRTSPTAEELQSGKANEWLAVYFVIIIFDCLRWRSVLVGFSVSGAKITWLAYFGLLRTLACVVAVPFSFLPLAAKYLRLAMMGLSNNGFLKNSATYANPKIKENAMVDSFILFCVCSLPKEYFCFVSCFLFL